MLIPFDSHHPQVDPRAWVAPTATLVGRVDVAELASIWFGVVIRADQDAISVGPRSNIQDNAVLHTDVGLHLRVGAGVVVGHAAVLHGCRIEDDVLVGMGAIVLNGARIGAGSIVGAGALVSRGDGRPTPVPGAGVAREGAPGGQPRRDDTHPQQRRQLPHLDDPARHALDREPSATPTRP